MCINAIQEQRIRKEATSQAIEKTIQAVETGLGTAIPRETTPSESRNIMQASSRDELRRIGRRGNPSPANPATDCATLRLAGPATGQPDCRRRGDFMRAFNAIIVGIVGGALVALLLHLVALVVGFSSVDDYTTLAFLIGWAGSAILIIKA